MPVTVGLVLAQAGLGGPGALSSSGPMLWSSTWIMRLTSASGLAAPRLSGGRCASRARLGRQFPRAVGIRAPSTRTGMDLDAGRVRADSISTRT